eukprot:scaffold9523_cov103-Cylindrotheca_fusiformis.AAC.15
MTDCKKEDNTSMDPSLKDDREELVRPTVPAQGVDMDLLYMIDKATMNSSSSTNDPDDVNKDEVRFAALACEHSYSKEDAIRKYYEGGAWRVPDTNYSTRAAWDSIKTEVLKTMEDETNLGDGYQITITGHSLGGALAWISLGDIRHKFSDFERPKVFTFAAPPVGNEPFLKKAMQECDPSSLSFLDNGDMIRYAISFVVKLQNGFLAENLYQQNMNLGSGHRMLGYYHGLMSSSRFKSVYVPPTHFYENVENLKVILRFNNWVFLNTYPPSKLLELRPQLKLRGNVISKEWTIFEGETEGQSQRVGFVVPMRPDSTYSLSDMWVPAVDNFPPVQAPLEMVFSVREMKVIVPLAGIEIISKGRSLYVSRDNVGTLQPFASRIRIPLYVHTNTEVIWTGPQYDDDLAPGTWQSQKVSRHAVRSFHLLFSSQRAVVNIRPIDVQNGVETHLGWATNDQSGDLKYPHFSFSNKPPIVRVEIKQYSNWGIVDFRFTNTQGQTWTLVNDPNGEWKTLNIPAGTFVRGVQAKYDPYTNIFYPGRGVTDIKIGYTPLN